MPYSPPWKSSKGLFISRIETCIPRNWKQTRNQNQNPNHCHKLDECSTISKTDSGEHLMVYPLVLNFKEFITKGDIRSAFRTFSSIRSQVLSVDCCDFVVEAVSSLLVVCSKQKLVSLGRQLHGCLIQLGLDKRRVLVPKLVTFYANVDLLRQAHFIVENSRVVHPLPWNILISGYIRNGLSKEALSAYKKMLRLGIWPDEFTYPSVLKACGEQTDIGFGVEVHKSIMAGNCGSSLFVQNALISMYTKCGEIEVARNLFNGMPNRDSISWNSMISGYASEGMWEEAFDLFEKMRIDGVELGIITWNTMISGCLQTGNYKGALHLLSQMKACAVILDAVSMVSGLGACSHIGAAKLGKEIHATSIRAGFDKLHNVQNALITMYARCEDLKHAYLVFRQMEEKDIITWNSIISGYAQYDNSDEASFLFREMLLCGFKPNYVTMASVLPLCARVANLQHGKELHCYILKHHDLSDHSVVSNSLVDMYARAGKISEARSVFESLSQRDVVTYTSLINGYGVLGRGEIALELFEQMKSSGIKPDHITLVAVLAACSHSGLLIQGQLLFAEMWSVYGIRPQLEHYACMVDLFGRAGMLKKAEEVIRKMPYEPSADIWATLIGACHIHHDTDLGEFAAEKLLAMKPNNSGYYVLIANMYAAAGCWNKLAAVRTSMRNLGVMKPAGCAWVDIGSGFEPFVVGDTSMELSDEIYSLVDELTEQMKDVAYGAAEKICMDIEVFEE